MNGTGVSGKAVTVRERVIEVVGQVGVPLLTRVIIELGKSIYGCSIPLSRLVGILEMGELAEYRTNPEKYPVWICPALTSMGFLPVQQIATLSSWAPESRIVASRSLRVIHLRTLLSLVSIADSGGQNVLNATEGLTYLVRRYAETVPGAVANVGGTLDSTRIRSAGLEELEQIETVDIEERAEAASRLKTFPEEVRYWGRPPMKWAGIGRGGDK